jgi:hypothetical protein
VAQRRRRLNHRWLAGKAVGGGARGKQVEEALRAVRERSSRAEKEDARENKRQVTY